MRGLNHVIVGSLVYLAADRAVGLGGPALVNCLGAAALGSLAPDLDSPHSFLGRRFWPLSWTVQAAVGHRGLTHSLAACLAVVLGAALAGMFWPLWRPYLWAGAIGYASHILADWLTSEGVPLFWPNRRRYRCPVNFRTDSLGETLFSLATGALLGFWLYRGGL